MDMDGHEYNLEQEWNEESDGLESNAMHDDEGNNDFESDRDDSEGCGNQDDNEECSNQGKDPRPNSGECSSHDHKPYIGQKFNSEKEAYEFYNLYAKVEGFSVRKHKWFWSKTRNCNIGRSYVYACEGHRKKDKRTSESSENKHRDTRAGCSVKIKLKLNADDKWVVCYLNEEHNHPPVTPSKVAKLRSHKQMAETTKSLIDNFSKTMGPAKIADALTTAQGHGSVVVSSQDVRSYSKKKRKNNMGSDCMSVIQSFVDMQAKDDGFYFEAELDEECRMRSVFWVDGRSRTAYHQFGDVLVFDTTYRTNTYSMPFAPFTGVNHHMQSILFGCGLLADETEDTFTWLFRTWLKAMGGKKPVSIITDQDGAMAKAIKNVFEGTHHRLCMWHIGQNEIRHLNAVKMKHEGFSSEYNKCKHSETIEEFESNWAQLIVRFEQEDNSWLKSMYEIRYHWIPCYMRHIFFAGMTTTQRSESMNSFFDGYVNSKTPLYEFVSQYEKALVHRRDQENHEDHMTLNTNPSFMFGNQLEVQAKNIYTRRVFGIFQAEFKKILSYVAKKHAEDGYVTTYKVGTHGSDMKNMVRIDERNNDATCMCKKFEFEGLLCSHILKVYQKMDVIEIPSKYILARWTIDARYGHVRPIALEENVESVTPMMVWSAREAALKSVDMGIRSVEHYKVFMPVLCNLIDDLDKIKLTPEECGSKHDSNVIPDQTSVPMTEQIHIRIRDPERIATKGRPKNSVRIRSALEETSHKAKQRACGYYKGKGHYISTCPYKKTSTEGPMEDQIDQSQLINEDPSETQSLS